MSEISFILTFIYINRREGRDVEILEFYTT